MDKQLTLWSPCSPSSVNWYQLASWQGVRSCEDLCHAVSLKRASGGQKAVCNPEICLEKKSHHPCSNHPYQMLEKNLKSANEGFNLTIILCPNFPCEPLIPGMHQLTAWCCPPVLHFSPIRTLIVINCAKSFMYVVNYSSVSEVHNMEQRFPTRPR